MPSLPTEKVIDNFTEVETGLPDDGAVSEGRRCFQCGYRSQIHRAPRPPFPEKKAIVPQNTEPVVQRRA
jgi:hypothetical protein